MARLINTDRLPDRRVVLRFDLTDLTKQNRFWMVLQNQGAEICLKHPGGDEDLVITTTSGYLAKWHMGHITLAEAKRRGLMSVEGPADLERDLATWGGLSTFADVKPMYQQKSQPAGRVVTSLRSTG